MSIEAILAIAAFVVLFGAWVIVPSRLRKHHEDAEEDEA
jgi:hypothetical protein